MILFAGDIHGYSDHLISAIAREQAAGTKVDALVLLGDLTGGENDRPVEERCHEIEAATGVAVWLIHGNHESDSEHEWRMFSTAQHRNLHGRVVEIAGVRVAGLGGVFRGEIWWPENNALCDVRRNFEDYAAYEKHVHELQGLSRRLSKLDKIRAEAIPDRIAGLMDTSKNGRLRKAQTSIFPAVYEVLATQKADILVTHEAPGCGLHPNGFETIVRLAQAMGVQALFHGHHHDSLDARYRTFDDQVGFRSYGVGLCGITDETGWIVEPGSGSAQA